MLVIPTTFQAERAAYLLVLVGGAVLYSLRAGWRLQRSVLMWGALCISASLIFMINGMVNDAPGALRVATVFVIWPILYLLFVGIAGRVETVLLFEKTIILGVIAAGLMGLGLVSGALAGYASVVSEGLAFQGAAVGVYGGYTEYRLYNMTTLMYGLPFLVGLVLLPRSGGDWLSRVWRGLAWVALGVALIACVLSGRRVFWLLAFLTPALVAGLFLVAGVRVDVKRLFYLGALVAFAAAAVASRSSLDVSSMFAQFASAFNAGLEQSANLRMEQLSALLSGWAEKPVLGHGAGAYSEAIVRSEEMPWAYELSYVALLFQTGLLGFIIYSAAVLWIFWTGIRVVRARSEAALVILPLLAGLAGFLFVNATNPYLLKFDYLWTIFLPLAAIKTFRIIRPPSTSSSSTGIQAPSFPTASLP